MAMGRGGLEIEFPTAVGGSNQQAVAAYLATPMTAAATGTRTGRGILVLHEEWGLTDSIRDICDRLARAGFVALAPDLLHGRCAMDPVRAQRLAKELDVDRAAGELDAAIEELLRQDATDGAKLGVLGFGMGGQLALLLASRNRRIGAVVDIYGAHPEIAPDLSHLEASVLAIFAGDDVANAESASHSLKVDLERAGVRASIQIRAGVRSGYMNDSWREAYDAIAAAEGWDALLAFFRAEIEIA